jgi:hypothetical protein
MASRLFTVDLDLGLNKAKRFTFEDFNTNPSNGDAAGRVIYWTGAGADQNHLKVYNGTAWKTLKYSTDDVVSISLSAPLDFTVSGSPAAYNGTLGFSWNDQVKNKVLAGPINGDADTPTFRLLAAEDIPSITSTKISDFAEAVADTVGLMVNSNNEESGISVSYDDSDNTLDFNVADFSITLTGDVTGTGTVTDLGNVSFATAVGNDSHNHTASTVTDFEEAAQDAVASLFNDLQSTYTGITFAFDDETNSVAVENTGVLEISAGTGISVSGFNDDITITNSGVTGISGTTNEITVSGSTGSVTIGLPDDVTIGGDLTVTGDLTVNGDVTTLNTATMNVEDNIFVLNSNVTGTPSANAGIEVERGTSTNASITWNETTDKWTAGLTGSEVEIARKYAETLATSATSYTITHNLNSLDVVASVYGTSTNSSNANQKVETGVVLVDANSITIEFNVAPSANDYRVVVVG